MNLVDSHCHLDMLSDTHDIEYYVQNAINNNITHLQTICVKVSQFTKILEISERFEKVYASVGDHPCYVSEKVICADELIEYAKHPKIIGLGETGLDYYRQDDRQTRIKQIESFEQHIEASIQNQLPVIIHMRDAEEDCTAIIKRYKKQYDFPALIHCFTASENFGKIMLDYGLYISISGIVTFKNAVSLQSAAKTFPLNRLLLETDSPYLAPVPMRGKENQPANLKYVAEFLANLRGNSVEEVASATTDNFFNLFKRAKR